MIVTRAKYWYEIAKEYEVEVYVLKAMLNLDKLKLKEGQRKLFPNQIREIYSQLGEPDTP